MLNRRSTAIASLLFFAGAIAGAFAKWYLVWLAQEIGGPEALGSYGLLFAVATPIFVAAQLGLRTIYLSQKCAWPWSTYVQFRLLGLALGTVALVVLIFVIPTLSVGLGITVLLMKIFDSILDLDLARIQYSGRILTVAVLSLIGAPLSLLFSTVGALATGNLSVAVLGAALSSLIVSMAARWQAARVVYIPDSENTGAREILQASVPVTSAQLLASLLLSLPSFFLASSADLVAVGIYAGISYILTVSDLLGSSISKVLITPLRNIVRDTGPNAAIRYICLTSARIAMIGLAGGAMFVLLGSKVFQFIYGPEFSLSYPVLSLLAAAAIFIVISHVQSVVLNVLNRYHKVAFSFFLACVVAACVGGLLEIVEVAPLTVATGMAAAGAATRAAMLLLGVIKSRAVHQL